MIINASNIVTFKVARDSPLRNVSDPWADTTTSINTSNIEIFKKTARDSSLSYLSSPWTDTTTPINVSKTVMKLQFIPPLGP